jgi:hypothetical protein
MEKNILSENSESKDEKTVVISNQAIPIASMHDSKVFISKASLNDSKLNRTILPALSALDITEINEKITLKTRQIRKLKEVVTDLEAEKKDLEKMLSH